MKISELTRIQREHLVWRLDNKTGVGLLTALAISQGKHGDVDLVEVFKKWGGKSCHSAKIHARKVINFILPERQSVDELQAGRELDALVAELMEFQQECQCNSWYGIFYIQCVATCAFCSKIVIPPYSTDISAAWQVVTRVRSKTATFSLECLSPTSDYWQATFKGGLDMGKACFNWIVIARADTAPLAICRTALKVVQSGQ